MNFRSFKRDIAHIIKCLAIVESFILFMLAVLAQTI